jgi:hypothetical protein
MVVNYHRDAKCEAKNLICDITFLDARATLKPSDAAWRESACQPGEDAPRAFCWAAIPNRAIASSYGAAPFP